MTANDQSIRLALAEMRGAVREQVPLGPLAHVRIGGPARWFVEPFSESDVGVVVRVCHELGMPLWVLGGGSNVLIADAGLPGVVMSLTGLNRVVRDGSRLSAGAGVTLPSLLRGARESGLAGLEILTGIPAHVGGAVAMNAGTRDGDTFEHLVSLTVVEPDGSVAILGRDDFAPSYRNGGLGERVVVHATFDLEPDDPKAIYARFEASLKRRNATQPVTERSVGCVFVNPDGESAGRLIEQAGCKLQQQGAIQVSAKHANYFVNLGGGTAADFLALMDAVRERVREHSGHELVPEVKLLGF
jgi:UDP-N-acetylmuramate dehydrogenase